MTKNISKRSIPGINSLLETEELQQLSDKYKPEFIKFITRNVVNGIRKELETAKPPSNIPEIIDIIKIKCEEVSEATLKHVINATGIVLHTNLGRAPLGDKILEEITGNISGYSNLEFDLISGKRQNRNFHVSQLINYLTNTEDSIVVNNNAAAVLLTLHTFAKDKEVIISRGEMIEIGESFRIHEVMEASGAIIKEVGTTNRTRISDYEKAISKNTALIIKPHKSNYTINGFTEEASIKDLSLLCKKNRIPLIYDLGSGLITDFKFLPEDTNEPTAAGATSSGADVVTFSGDKLLGGPQCGIIAGKKRFISKIKSAPMLRALRVGKLTYAALHGALKQYIVPQNKITLPAIQMLQQSENDLLNKTKKLSELLHKNSIENRIVESKAQCGGGTMPEYFIPSFAVELITCSKKPKEQYLALLNSTYPVVGILRKGKLLLDVYTIDENEFERLILTCSKTFNQA